ncbi:MAG: methyltransferase domain-containing protein [Proteobacteria bacterium]|nr:methyltransferase domain-containing protein [Pseudomonadota bacterium]
MSDTYESARDPISSPTMTSYADRDKAFLNRSGTDGLTVDELRSTRAMWWDRAFTEMLLAELANPRRLVDIGCGLGAAAAALLPELPGLQYVGVDIDRMRLALAAPATYVAACAEALPFPNGAADVALFIATLQHVDDPVIVLREARRVAHRVVAVEPDNVAQQFYFGERLPGVTAASAALVSTVRRGDIAIGPRVPDLCVEAGFAAVRMRAYAIGVFRRGNADAFADWLRPILRIVDERLGTEVNCDAEISAWRASVPGNPVRHCGVVVPTIITHAS